MNKPRIVIADDHQVMADGLRGLLEPEFEVVAVVADGRVLGILSIGDLVKSSLADKQQLIEQLERYITGGR